MSDSEVNPEEKKKSSFGIILFLIILLAGLTGAWMYQKQNASESHAGHDHSADHAHGADHDHTMESNLDIESLSKPRILGDETAPLKISEHSSFSCGACGKFHKENFNKIKADYIDTGKAYLIYDDFPRNQLDLTIGAIARCVPDDSYFKFVQLVFETQSDWYGTSDEIETIKENAVLAGADADQVEECANDKALKEALAFSSKRAYDEHGVNRTPTLVLNGSSLVTGTDPYPEVQKAIEQALADIENDKVIDEPDVEIEKTTSEVDEKMSAPAGIATNDAKQSAEVTSAAGVESTKSTSPTDVDDVQGFNLKEAKTPRILGDTNAPIKIVEHSSFGCPHCSEFHKDNFKKLKAEYIDTGKAYLVFDDFPLSAADIEIGALARCVPEDSYFKFIQYVFETQEEWKKQPKFIEYLKQNAMMTGATSEQLQECLDNRELKEALAQRGHNAYQRKGVQGTPSLIINDGNPISVSVQIMSYAQIKEVLDKALEKEAQ